MAWQGTQPQIAFAHEGLDQHGSSSRETYSYFKWGFVTGAGVSAGPDSGDNEKDDRGAGLAFLIIVLVFVVLFALGVVAYTKWRQKQRRDQQARFVKMFEDDDELDAELGLKEDDL